MADTEPTTIATYLTAGGVLGGILAKAIVALWKWANKGNDALIVELRASNAVMADRLKRAEDMHTARCVDLDKMRDERDALKERFAAHVIRTDDYADVPTGVHNLAVVMDPDKPTPR